MNDHREEIARNLEEEQQILEVIRAKTGRKYVRVGQIPTAEDASIAAEILPILSELLPHFVRTDVRAGIYMRFGTEYAAPFVDQMLEWLHAESCPDGRNILKQCLREAMRPSDAEKVWLILQGVPRCDADYPLMQKLARSRVVGREVRDRLVDNLEAGLVPGWSLAAVAAVKDDRIQHWFLDRQEDSDPDIRRVARRVAAKAKALPQGLHLMPHEPNRLGELFSTEVDCDQLSTLLQGLSVRFEFQIPTSIRSAVFTEKLEVDQWAAIEARAGDGNCIEMWFRLEQIDVVEVVLLRR